MPAKKPSILNVKNDTKADKAARANAESAMIPKTELSIKLPEKLKGKGHAIAAATWKRIISLYLEIDGTIATAFDVTLLVEYCLADEEVREIASMRRDVKLDWEKNEKAAKKVKPTTETLKDWVAMWNIVNSLLKLFKEYDARMDQKRKLLLSYSQSLYLTPRSRAGVAPAVKEPPEPEDPTEKLLNE